MLPGQKFPAFMTALSFPVKTKVTTPASYQRSESPLRNEESGAKVHGLLRGAGKRRVLEDHSLVSVNQDAIFYLPAHCAGEHDFFEVSAFSDQVVDRIAMRYADYILLDDRAIVEDFGHVVACSADQFYSAFKRLMIRPRSDKRGQKRVVNIYDPLWIFIHEVIRQNLHIAGQHHEVGLVSRDQRMNCRFGLIFVFLRYCHDGVGNFVKI